MAIKTEGIEVTYLIRPDDSISFATIQNIATGKLLGRSTAGSGDIEET
jgi:hypothetical protein